MALDPNVTSKENQDFQKRLKRLGYNVPTNGELDGKTMRAVQDLAARIGYRSSVQDIDRAFLKALDAFENQTFHRITLGSKTYIVDDKDYAKLVKALGPKAEAAMQRWVSMASYAYGLWEADSRNKADNWLIGSVLELRAGVKLPDAQVMRKAVTAAETLKKKARALDLSESEFRQLVRTIQTAMEAINSYRDGLFAGGENLVKELEFVRDTSLLTVQVLGAVVSGGTSTVASQVVLQAGIASYGQVLGEIDTATRTSNYSVGAGAARVALAGGAGAIIGWAVKGANGKMLEDAVLKLALKETSPLLRQYVIKAMTAGGLKIIEDALKALPGIADPTKKWTLESMAKEAVQSFLTGIGAKALGSAAEKLAKGVGNVVTPDRIQKLAGKAKLDKIAVAAIKKKMNDVSARTVQQVLQDWRPGDDPKKFEQEVEKRVLQSPEVQAEVRKQTQAKN